MFIAIFFATFQRMVTIHHFRSVMTLKLRLGTSKIRKFWHFFATALPLTGWSVLFKGASDRLHFRNCVQKTDPFF